MTLRDRIERRWVPRAIVALSQVDWPARISARVRRTAGRRERVELFFAFDDPCSAVAVLDLSTRLGGREADLVLTPVVARGPRDDPATVAKRRYAIVDARRLARSRLGLELGRSAPLEAADTAFLAEWVAGSAANPNRFITPALRRLWLYDDGPVDRAAFELLWREAMGVAPDPNPEGVRAAERRMTRGTGPYDTPAAVIGRRWWFAHDRPQQIVDRLDELGWG
jgi:2-hydroxychromene-2-carboxylate isomerase